MLRNRLDRLVTLRENAEDKALETLAQREAQVRQAAEVAERAWAKARADHRFAGDASQWTVVELARERAAHHAKLAQQELDRRKAVADQARQAHHAAHQQTEVVRRVADTRREQQRVEEARREQKAQDELSALMFGLKMRRSA